MRDIDEATIAVYTSTLFALARDAWEQGNVVAFDFVKSYLVGLVPSSALQSFCDELAPSVPMQLRRDTSRPSGGATVSNPKPPPPLPPEPFRVRESDTLKW